MQFFLFFWKTPVFACVICAMWTKRVLWLTKYSIATNEHELTQIFRQDNRIDWIFILSQRSLRTQRFFCDSRFTRYEIRNLLTRINTDFLSRILLYYRRIITDNSTDPGYKDSYEITKEQLEYLAKCVELRVLNEENWWSM